MHNDPMEAKPLPGTVEEDFIFGKELDFLSSQSNRINSKNFINCKGNRSIGIRYDDKGEVMQRSILGNSAMFEKTKSSLA